MKLPPSFSLKTLGFVFFGGVMVATVCFLAYQTVKLEKALKSIKSLETSQAYFTENFSNELFEDHLKVLDSISSQSVSQALQAELDSIKSKIPEEEKSVSAIYDTLEVLDQKILRNTKAGLKEPDLAVLKTEWGAFLLDKNFEGINSSISAQISALDDDYLAYVKKLEEEAAKAVAATGYSYQSVKTERGAFGASVIKIPLRDVKVKTVSASSGSCKNNCETKSLADYVKDNGGFAGMNGSYFCPPDYSSCEGKVNSSDYGFYDSKEGKWEHKDALSWSKTGLMTFSGTSANFYKKSSDYGGGGVTAGISNYPSLVKDGDIVVNDGDLTAFQKDIKGPRGVIGVGGENLYLAIIYGATVKDAAYAIRALGAKNALNLDGGGSSAMYVNGKYVVGPGRSLPNAVVLTK